MSRFLLGALLALIGAAACSSPKPPEGNLPEAPASPADPIDSTPAETPISAGAAANEGAEPVIQKLFVRERLVDCQGEGARKCLQVREVESGEWRNFYATIEGFDYEEAHAYEIRVEVMDVQQPPADGTSLRYRLVEIISKRKVIPSKTGE